MRKYAKKCIFISLILFGLFFTCDIEVKAKTLNELKSELSTLKDKYNQNETTKKLTEEQINRVKGEIDSINKQIDDINKQIDDLNADIEKRNQDIAKMAEEIKSIIHYYQVTNVQNMYFEYVFNADNYTDLIYRFAVTEQLSDYREKKD